MILKVTSKVLLLALVVAVTSCGSVTPTPDGAAAGAAGSSGGDTSGSVGSAGAGGTSGAAGNGGTTGAGGTGGGSVLACRLDMGDCPQGFTCACGGAGPVGMCTCHRNCTDNTQCIVGETCGCPGAMTAARYCVNACFCSCD
jgi:hypothetical protein